MVDNLSRWAGFELLGSVNFVPIRSKLGQSVANVVVVSVAWSAAVGAPFWRSMVLFWAITDDVELKGSSIEGLMSVGHRGSS